MTRKQRQVERVEFDIGDLTQIGTWMARLAGAGDGWINLIPRMTDDDERPTSLGFFALFGGAPGFTMCTWIPGGGDQPERNQTNIGISHTTGRRAAGELRSLAIPVPETWLVDQDHPRRGLILRVPADEPHEQVLLWSLRAVAALIAPRPVRRWEADIYLPATA